MLKSYEIPLLLSALFAFACGGNAVDVGHSQNPGWVDAPASDAPASEHSAAAPQVVYQSEAARIFGFALDGTTLYALIDHGRSFELVSCPIEHCRSQRKVLLRSPKLGEEGADRTPLVLTGGWLYWMVANGGPSGVAGCPATGCAEAQLLPTTFGSLLVGDEDGAYWIDEDKSLLRIAPSAATPERLRSLADEIAEQILGPRHLLARGEYMYFSLGYDVSTIHRVHKDGTGASEVLATDEEISGLAVTPDAIYYPTQILTGRIAQCPPDGCTVGARTLAANQRWPKETQIDGSEAFWLSSATFSDNVAYATLSSCELPDCASVKQRASDIPIRDLSDEYSRGPTFAVSPQALVWLAPDGDFGTSFWRSSR
jgi:hypothetical protein